MEMLKKALDIQIIMTNLKSTLDIIKQPVIDVRIHAQRFQTRR